MSLNTSLALDEEQKRRCCLACGADFDTNEASLRLVKPCRSCSSDYCHDCLRDMFTTKDVSRMPPRCCTLIQPYMASGLVSADELSDYRARFEEWLTADGTYCPSITCSAFISPRHLKNFSLGSMAEATTDGPFTIQTVLRNVLKRVQKCPASRFFRSPTRFDDLPEYHAKIKVHMDLSIIQRKAGSSYQSVSEMAADFRLMYENARRYNRTLAHPVVQASEQLVAEFQKELSTEVNMLITASQKNPRSKIFSCPKCRIAICASCKQIEHTGNPCNNSKADDELAMLVQFGYKRCPKCRIGVKRMFGCSHMLCRCGAHWCYRCERQIEECQGTCDPDGVSSESESESESEDEDEDGEGKDQEDADLQGDLDQGGSRRWDTGNFDFGSDPGAQPQAQIWKCSHDFTDFVPKQDEFNRGDLSLLDCNLCFVELRPTLQPILAVRPRRTYAAVVAGKRKRLGSISENAATTAAQSVLSKGSSKAFECRTCSLIVCGACCVQTDMHGSQ
ncbi:hypothetical protein K431DRAFT_288525 [Polychaeton citri CBS 116435]|uniref:RING-type domain-containing protein n=1 Tax=Polychaeton citri CBS 116435 TaxID=1314669 RepID=A0A9P4UM02_9PEZI|nr:hypothetical protein K431DRAFT_288525 [Polychaeton citri CBS 116435]